MQHAQAFSAERVAAMYEYARDLLADREFIATIIAEVQASGAVVSLDHVLHGRLALILLCEFALRTPLGSPVPQSLALHLKSKTRLSDR